ncbi:MAG: 4Fe-4S dicluster domain-containing protein [Deltaproteobacteria bacterium]|nr:4Fe-4S dicluster domain-containing protein [Deltaproteobacteria bacterium]
MKIMDNVSRREFLKDGCKLASACMILNVLPIKIPNAFASDEASATQAGLEAKDGYNWGNHYYAYLIDTRKCIGCGMCVQACSRENNVPDGFFRTWVERYEISERGEVFVDSPHGGINGFEATNPGFNATKAFFVPKMCNHCEHTPCIQVCPVGASYATKEGMVLVDSERCVGCGYCVQACPYGSRFINPITHTADKCTWCYHRITKGLKPACVQACPTGARKFGDLKDEHDEVRKILASERIGILQAEKLTKPKCYYIGLDKEVR